MLIQWHPGLLALIPNRPYHALVDSHAHVLADDHEVYHVRLVVVDLFVTEHRRHGIVTDVKADPDPAPEYLYGDVLIEAVVEKDALLGVSG